MAAPWVRLGRRLLPRSLARAASWWANLPARIAAIEQSTEQLAVRALREEYGDDERMEWERREMRVFSQNGEDGLLLHLFSRLGTTNRYAVEFGCGDGTEFNSLNLLANWGWRALLVEGDRRKAAQARREIDRRLSARAAEVEIVEALLTRENIDALLAERTAEPEPDLLSIDVDGMDYWLWRAIERLRPRVVVIEYNAAFGPERSITVPYEPRFDAHRHHRSGLYHGASLSALVKLGREKGYRLVGCESQGVNAFFVRDDVAGDLPEPLVTSAYRPLSSRYTEESSEERFARVRHLRYEEV